MGSWSILQSVLVFTVLSASCLILASATNVETTVHIQPDGDCSTNVSNASISHDCHTIDMALQGIQSSSILQLTPGVHTIRNLSIVSNKSDVSIIGDPNNPANVVIKCDGSYGLIFINVHRLHLIGITIRNCGFNRHDGVYNLFSVIRNRINLFYEPFDDFSTGLLLVDCQDLLMAQMVIQENEGFGLVGINIIGTSHFTQVRFSNNTPAACQLEITPSLGGSGGGIFLLFQDYFEKSRNIQAENSTLIFEEDLIDHNFNCRRDPFITLYNVLSRSLEHQYDFDNNILGAGGLTVNIGQVAYTINAIIDRCTFTENFGLYHSSAMEINQNELTGNSNVFIKNSLFYRNGLPQSGTSNALTPFGTLMAVFSAPLPVTVLNQQLSSRVITNVQMINCTFKENIATHGAGVAVLSFGSTSSVVDDTLQLQNCSFITNSGNFGSALFVTELSYSAFESVMKVIIKSIQAEENRGLESEGTAVIDISYTNLTLTGQNRLSRNSHTAITATSGIIKVTGLTTFSENVGITGGGLHLERESYVVMIDHAEIVFNRNIGLVAGGAIWADVVANYDCFLFIDQIDFFCNIFDSCTEPRNRFIIKFLENDAPLGGSLFGSNVTNCPWNLHGINSLGPNDFIINSTALSELNPLMFPIYHDPPLSNHSATTIINTSPRFIATKTTNSSLQYTTSANIEVAPGQEFILPLAAFDRLDQSVPLTIFSRITSGVQNGTLTTSRIGTTNRFLLTGGGVGSEYSNVPLRIFGAQNTEHHIFITTDEVQLESDFALNVTLTTCSIGFEYDAAGLSCVCDLPGHLNGVSCNINGTISYEEIDWIGFDEGGNYIQAPCILDYCQPGVTVFNLSQRDDQCSHDRSGILCGQCAEGYSRVIGSTFECRNCESNIYLAFIVLFVVLGIVLFFILAVFNVNITDGFINGFIFYSNIISVYTSTFVPITDIRGIVPQVVISFLNSEFGIVTCFYVGATELALTGMSLAFPTYLMLILLLIVIFARCIPHGKVSAFFREIKVTHVFATLLLYSYASVMETCINMFAFLVVDHANPSLRWRRDPNVIYGTGLHLFLLLLCAVLMIALLPLPIILISPRISYNIPYVKNLKPLIDAFTAPFAPNRSFWVSLRLLFRIIVYLVAAPGVSSTQLLIITFLVSFLLLLQAYLKPFKSASRNIVDITLMFNLMLFSITSLVVFTITDDRPGVNETDFRFVLTYIFSIMLLLLLIHYVLKRFSCTRKPYEKAIKSLKIKLHLKKNIESKRTNSTLSARNPMTQEVTHTSVNLDELTNGVLHETLLESHDHSTKTA